MNRADSKPPISIAGMGQTGPALEETRSIAEMVLSAVEQALADAGASYDDLDAVVTASVDLFDGLTASNIAVTEVVGAVMKPETRISGDALGAVAHAACQIWAGAYERVLVVAHGKPSMSDYQRLTHWAFDPVYLQPLGVDFLTCAGLQAQFLAARQEGAEARWARIAALRRAAAAQSGGMLESCNEQAVLQSPAVAAPLRKEMCAPLADGACAVLLRRSEAAMPGEVLLTGVGYDLEPHSLGARNLGAWEGLSRACRRACRVAGIESPAGAFDLAEPSCYYAHEEPLFVEASGIAEATPLSPEGGLFGGAVPVAAGLSRLIAAARHLQHTSGRARALAHGTWGPAGQGHAVAVLEARA